LNTYPDGQYWIIDEKTKRDALVLRETLAEFRIEAEVTGISKGPVITMYEILPAHGVKISKITNLADNIALRLAASSVRIVAPIPGKHAVGIEVPNERRSVVSLREIIEHEQFRSAKMSIPVALGKDISGGVQFTDLNQTPHLLIAGATGSGKSVCVNAIILSILYRRSPEEVKLILIDPKIVELKLYNGIPHLLTPVITDPKKAFQALQYCIYEMERRYSILSKLDVRDIKSYNRRVKERGLAQEKLPYIVVVIDEFADLMATSGKDLEDTLRRLSALARAIGIHLVLATQRPSVDVITGLIKANIPSRIAFMVASKFDSRVIIDMVGAEKLLGQGDMLYSGPTSPFPMRMQGAYVSEEEVERAVAHVKTLGEPEYIDDEIFYDEEEENTEPGLFDDGDGDPLFEKALEIVMQQGKASASFIQRRLKIGYNRSARLVELMEERGIVGPSQGSKPRDVIRNPEIRSRPDAGQSPDRSS
jgi:S-DNA-T family DNA segregation ATPase FtsK/SpoIIIE